MSDFNIVVAHFGHHNRVVMTDTLYQYDYGQKLKVEGITALPQTFQAHFSNVQRGGVSITVTGINGMVDVPNSLLMTGKRIYCWIYVTETGSGETVYQILMPVQSRPMPEYYDVEDVGVFDSVVNQVAEYAATATTGATSATASATAAAGSETAAAASASAAADSAENAAASEANAEASASAAQASDASAATAANTATSKAAEAAQSATSAGSAADRAEAAQEAAETAQGAAETAATSATADAATATAKATAAAASATTASTKATDATNAATTATAQAVAAEAAKVTAVEAKTAAQNAQSAAETAATNATAKATEAAASATAAAQAAASINTPDSALSDTSTNAVQNKVITGELTDVKTAIKKSAFAVRLPLYPCMFIGNAYMNGSSSVSENTHSIAPIKSIGGITEPIHVYSTDENIYFLWKPVSDGTTTMRQADEFTFDGGDKILLNVLTHDNTNVTVTDLDSVHIMTSKACYDTYVEQTFYHITGTQRFDNYGVGDNIYRYGMYTDTDKLGFAQRGKSAYRLTPRPYICDHDVTLYCASYGNNNPTMEVVVNGTLTTIGAGDWTTVAANTPFQVAFKSTATSTTNTMSNSAIIVVEGVEPTTNIVQLLCNNTVTRADTSFMAGGKIFMISRDTEAIYSVLVNGVFTKSNVALDHSAGHANSCNYDNGYVYVSDWTESIIHVYAVDTEAETLTYVKDITLTTDFGCLGFYVQNQEKEIYFFGWQSGTAATVPNNIVYGLYVKVGDGYEIAWVKKATRPVIMQSMTVQDDGIFFSEVDSSYDTLNVCRVDINKATMTCVSAVGTLASSEAEGIIPVAEKSFLINDKTGRLYFVAGAFS